MKSSPFYLCLFFSFLDWYWNILQAFPPSGIVVFGSQLHTHLRGVRILTRHFRGTEELRELNRDDYYSHHFQEMRNLHYKPRVLPVSFFSYLYTEFLAKYIFFPFFGLLIVTLSSFLICTYLLFSYKKLFIWIVNSYTVIMENPPTS